MLQSNKIKLNDEYKLQSNKMKLNDENKLPSNKMKLNDENKLPSNKMKLNDENKLPSNKMKLNDENGLTLAAFLPLFPMITLTCPFFVLRRSTPGLRTSSPSGEKAVWNGMLILFGIVPRWYLALSRNKISY